MIEFLIHPLNRQYIYIKKRKGLFEILLIVININEKYKKNYD